MTSLFQKIIKPRNTQLLNKAQQHIPKINKFLEDYKNLNAEEIKQKSIALKNKVLKKSEQGQEIDSGILEEAFALVSIASSRTLNMAHFPVQFIGGIVLHEGKIAEMQTGEGKTLTSTLPAFLNALLGRGVHIVTANDYLAKRDAELVKPLFEYLGLIVDVIYPNQKLEEKKAAYAADITYGTATEFGFDYLRDNCASSLENQVQRPLYYAIIDEVDSILIDQARTPLIISQPKENDKEVWIAINSFINHLKETSDNAEEHGDFILNHKNKEVYLTERGHENVETYLQSLNMLSSDESLYQSKNIVLLHHTLNLLKAYYLYSKNVDYVEENKQIIIIDENTGRKMHGRRWNDGLQQALEAKEQVEIQAESHTAASITFQNFFKIYKKIAGMTGTADTEAQEFFDIYNMEVVVIPTNKPRLRVDGEDQIYFTEKAKNKALLQHVIEIHRTGQPILIGSSSIENSELLSDILNKAKLPHHLLNANQNEQEASIIANAGRFNQITIATNMAGRGTDIILGGSPEGRDATEWKLEHEKVKEVGGLFVLGSERHEARRIDNQLIGRAGRQGDLGASQFYLSFEDRLMKLFAPESVRNMLMKLGTNPDEAIEHPLISNSVRKAQGKIESMYADMRKSLLEYDNINNEHRKIVYSMRKKLLHVKTLADLENGFLNNLSDFVEGLNLREGLEHINKEFNVQTTLTFAEELPENVFHNAVLKKYEDNKGKLPEEVFLSILSQIYLHTLDRLWSEHLEKLDYLKNGIHLRAYGQKDPKQEYKKEAYTMMEEFLNEYNYDVLKSIGGLQITMNSPTETVTS